MTKVYSFSNEVVQLVFTPFRLTFRGWLSRSSQNQTSDAVFCSSEANSNAKIQRRGHKRLLHRSDLSLQPFLAPPPDHHTNHHSDYRNNRSGVERLVLVPQL